MLKKILLLALALGSSTLIAKEQNIAKIEHIVVVYFENRSFDNLFRGFKGAYSSENPKTPYLQQSDENGMVYKSLPISDEAVKAGIPSDLPNEPFLIDKYVSQDKTMPDLVHRFYQNKSQINDGKNDKFVLVSDAKGLAMGYHDMSKSSLWKYAKKYTLCDNFFAGAYGGSFLNHQWLIAASTPSFFDANDSKVKKYVIDKDENTLKDGVLTPDGYAVNTIQPFAKPYHPKAADQDKRLPPQTHDTIGDRLSQKHISWAWYSGGYDTVMGGNETEHYQYHHNPFAYFAKYDVGTSGRNHLKDEKNFFQAIKDRKLPKVSFVKPSASDNQHPGYASVKNADDKLDQIVKAVMSNKKIWEKSVIIVTYDENGGLWDHVAPPKIDRWGPGTRIPALIISPFAKKSFVDHTPYDTTSILKFIELRFGLSPLSERDKNANALMPHLKH